MCGEDGRKKNRHINKRSLTQESSFYDIRKMGESEEERPGLSLAKVRELAASVTALKKTLQSMRSSKNEKPMKQQQRKQQRAGERRAPYFFFVCVCGGGIAQARVSVRGANMPA